MEIEENTSSSSDGRVGEDYDSYAIFLPANNTVDIIAKDVDTSMDLDIRLFDFSTTEITGSFVKEDCGTTSLTDYDDACVWQWTPPSSSWYFFKIHDTNALNYDARYKVIINKEDDHGNNAWGSTPIVATAPNVGEVPYSGSFESTTDSDNFRVFLPEAATYLEVHTCEVDSGVETEISLYQGSRVGNRFNASTYVSTASYQYPGCDTGSITALYQPPGGVPAGWYFIKVEPSSGSTTGNWDLIAMASTQAGPSGYETDENNTPVEFNDWCEIASGDFRWMNVAGAVGYRQGDTDDRFIISDLEEGERIRISTHAGIRVKIFSDNSEHYFNEQNPFDPIPLLNNYNGNVLPVEQFSGEISFIAPRTDDYIIEFSSAFSNSRTWTAEIVKIHDSWNTTPLPEYF